MDRRVIAAALAWPLLVLSGCGDDEGQDGSEADPTSTAAAADSDEASVEDTMVDFLLTGDCDLATDDYLLDLHLLSDEETTRDEACAQWERTFVEPQYDEDDIVLSELEIDGDLATVEVGSDYVNITTLYQLRLVDGSWLVSGDEYNTDGL